jgi:hypothetical protein
MKLSDYVDLVDDDGNKLEQARRKIKDYDREIICRLYSYGARPASLALDYEVDVSTIYAVLRKC